MEKRNKRMKEEEERKTMGKDEGKTIRKRRDDVEEKEEDREFLLFHADGAAVHTPQQQRSFYACQEG